MGDELLQFRSSSPIALLQLMLGKNGTTEKPCTKNDGWKMNYGAERFLDHLSMGRDY
jgi:hypothetical protein